MSDPASTQRTRVLLDRIGAGDRAAAADLLALAYAELHGLAERAMRGNEAHTLQPTALVHEACLRMLGGEAGRSWKDKAHLLAVGAKAMRSVLVDHARRRQAEKRGGGAQRLELEAIEPFVDSDGEAVDLVALDAALAKLAAEDARLAEIVELRFFGGLSVEETAGVLGVSEPTVVRGWRVARLFLLRELEPG